MTHKDKVWTKVINPGKGPDGQIFCKITSKLGKHNRRILSISGVEGPWKNGNCAGGSGQINMHYEHRNKAHNDVRYSSLTKPKDIDFNKPWNTKLWYDFLEAWKLYHLNDSNAGCKHQKKMGWNNDDMSKPCPECGYLYGHEWKYEPVPNKIWNFLESLPDSERYPAWV